MDEDAEKIKLLLELKGLFEAIMKIDRLNAGMTIRFADGKEFLIIRRK